MMQGYFKSQNRETVIFDAFYRKNPCGGGYAIAAGLQQVIDYIKNLRFSEEDIAYLQSLSMFDDDFLEYLRSFRFSGDIYAIPEGTVIFPEGTAGQGDRAYYGSPISRNCHPEHH